MSMAGDPSICPPPTGAFRSDPTNDSYRWSPGALQAGFDDDETRVTGLCQRRVGPVRWSVPRGTRVQEGGEGRQRLSAPPFCF